MGFLLGLHAVGEFFVYARVYVVDRLFSCLVVMLLVLDVVLDQAQMFVLQGALYEVFAQYSPVIFSTLWVQLGCAD